MKFNNPNHPLAKFSILFVLVIGPFFGITQGTRTKPVRPQTQTTIPASRGDVPPGEPRMGTTYSLQGLSPVVEKEAKDDRLNILSPELVKTFSNTITANELEAHLGFLASDAVEGRETGEKGQKIAAIYLASQFQRLGLKAPLMENGKPSYFQKFPLRYTSIESASIQFGPKKSYKLMEDFFSYHKTAFLSDLDKELVFGGYGIDDKKYDNLTGIDVRGKVVVVYGGEPKDSEGWFLISGNEENSKWGEDEKAKTETLTRKGAAAMLVILSEETFSSQINSRWMKHLTDSPSLELDEGKEDKLIPVYYISQEMAAELFKSAKTSTEEVKNELNKAPSVSGIVFKKQRFNLKTDGSSRIIFSENVLGYLEGTDKKDELVILTAHYDHLGIKDGEVFNGADDDGSGTAALLELAEAFSKAAEAGYRPRRSILFMPVAGEEKGLLGSRYYSDHPVFPLENTVCDLNIDMIGRIDKEHKENPEYVYIIGSDKLSSELHEANESANANYPSINLDYTFNKPDDPNRFYYRSDHYNFAKKGIPVIFYFTGVHEDYHKSTDTIEKIMFPKMTKIVQLVFGTAWEVANREKRLEVDKENDFPSNR